MRKKSYPSDISREQFARIQPLLEGIRKRTKPRRVDLYEVFCAVLYLLKSGCQWRMLPGEFPKWRTVHSYFAQWSEPDPDGISVLERANKDPRPKGRGIFRTRQADSPHGASGIPYPDSSHTFRSSLRLRAFLPYWQSNRPSKTRLPIIASSLLDTA
jgi:transposase